MAINVWGIRNERFEGDRVVVGSLECLSTGEWQSFQVALVGCNLWAQKGSFYVFMENEPKALRIPLRVVLVQTNSAGSVAVDGVLLERMVQVKIEKQMAKRK